MAGPPLIPKVLTRQRVLAARVIAVIADFVQIVGFPVFGEGFASPANDALDVAVAGLMIWLVGWHWAFLPSLAAELVPAFDLVPTWTMAVFIATRGSKGAAANPPVPPPNAPATPR